uniref:Uncharacterized protein n=1 Tax=Arundo donax TaxID=35708 RepID=A0A0A9B2Z6_ARUDO
MEFNMTMCKSRCRLGSLETGAMEETSGHVTVGLKHRISVVPECR